MKMRKKKQNLDDEFPILDIRFSTRDELGNTLNYVRYIDLSRISDKKYHPRLLSLSNKVNQYLLSYRYLENPIR